MATERNTMAETSAAVEARSTTALYVGDLDGSVTEEDLNRLFGQIGNVESVKICTDHVTKRSLGYGYVNYTNPQHAAGAIHDLNFTPLKGKHIRISYSNRDASLRRSGAGNVFVKNLDRGIDHRRLYEVFSSFGNILSSKVATDSSGRSKGYGFVQYDSEEAAQKAIEQLNGALVHGNTLYVAPFICKQDREPADKTKFTNVFVRNLSGSTTEEELRIIFGVFGTITSAAVMRDEDGNSKCFGFVNFENAEDAAKSVAVLNGQKFNGKKWYVARAQKKFERERELGLQYAKEVIERSLGLNNLYIKYLDDWIDDDKLRELFSPFGTITSYKVLRDAKGVSKGTGFVGFWTAQQASRAIAEMNGKIVGSKPLYVAIAEKKEARRQRMQAMFNARPNSTMAAVTSHIPIYSPGSLAAGHHVFYTPLLPPVFQPGLGYQQQFRPGPSSVVPNLLLPLVTPQVQAPQIPVPMLHQQMMLRASTFHFPPGFGPSGVSAQGSTTAGILSLPRDITPLKVHPIPVTLASALTNASPAYQQTMLGMHLYPLVEQLEHEMAGKVTDMLLEMDQSEVLHLLKSPESLRAKVAEALEVIRSAPPLQEYPDSLAEHLASLVLDD